jgi:hypothetical protein
MMSKESISNHSLSKTFSNMTNEEKNDYINEQILMRSGNDKLREHRKQWENNFFKMFFKEIYDDLRIKLLKSCAGNNVNRSYKRRNNFDKKWLILVINDYRRYRSLSEGKGKKIPFLDTNNRLRVIDEKIAPVVFCLKKMGIKTCCSCEGNQDEGHSYTPYITTDKNNKIPLGLLNYLTSKGLKYEFKDKNRYCEDSLHARFEHSKKIEGRLLFLRAVTEWSIINGITNITELKNEWKK